MIVNLLILGTAMATGIRFEELPCPHGEGTVRKFYKVSSNTLGGYDSDLAVYSTRGQFREHAISTCPSSYFSALGADLERPIPETQRSAVDAAIALSRSEWLDKTDPQVWERYDTAARIASALGRDPLEIAELYLNASWTARDAAVGIYVGGLEGPKAAHDILKIGEAELSKDLTSDARKVLQYNLARVAHRGGFTAQRDEHLAAYLRLTNLTGAERSAGQRFKQIAQHVEPRYQRAAIHALTAALSKKTTDIRMMQARYQQADLYRRLGDHSRAADGFRRTLKDPNTPPEIHAMAAFLLEEIGK